MNINEQGNQEGNSAMEGGSVAWEPAETCPLREEGRKALRNHCLVWMVNHPPLSRSRLTHQSDPFRHLQVTRRIFRCNRTLNRVGFTTARVSSRGQYCATRPSQEPQDLCTRLASGRRFLVGFSLHAGGSDGKESAHDAGDPGSIPGLGRCPGEGNCYPLQYSCLENSMDRGAWWARVHGVEKSRTRLWLTLSLSL